MKDSEKLVLFRQYMINKGLDKKRIDYNLKVVSYFINSVLFFFNETLESFDSFTFDEFTDKITLIDEEFGGREGIKDMLKAMLELTEFLKEYKFIKGGKIAFYKRMFSNEEYYLHKYDILKGKKSEAKEEIKNVMNSEFAKKTLRVIEEINCSEFKTIIVIDKLLNDIPISNEISSNKLEFIKNALNNMELIEINKGNYSVTKLGRIFSRLEPEQKFAVLMYYIFVEKKWNSNDLLNEYDDEIFSNLIYITTTLFNKSDVIRFLGDDTVNISNLYIGVGSDANRIKNIEDDKNYSLLFDIFFIGCGLIEKRNIDDSIYEYRITEIGKHIINNLIWEYNSTSRRRLQTIPYIIRRKEYTTAEDEIKKYLLIFGENSIILDLLGQVLLLQKKFKLAYEILIYAYQRANKRSVAFKSIVYHLILCCRKLQKEDETKFYEERLIEINSKA